MKEIFNILRHRGLQIKIMLRFYFTLVRVTTIKKTNNKGFREKENHCWGGAYDWFIYYGNQFEESSQNKKKVP